MLTLTFGPRKNLTSLLDSSYRASYWVNTFGLFIWPIFAATCDLRLTMLDLTLPFRPRSNMTSHYSHKVSYWWWIHWNIFLGQISCYSWQYSIWPVKAKVTWYSRWIIHAEFLIGGQDIWHANWAQIGRYNWLKTGTAQIEKCRMPSNPEKLLQTIESQSICISM